MRDELFGMGHRTGQLLDLQREMQAYWNDAMSRDIRNRHLSPHENSSKDMLRSLKSQQDALDSSATHLKQAKTQRKEGERASADVEQHLKYASDELVRSQRYMEQMKKLEGQGRIQLASVQDFINMANEAGK
jgi:hypothetical protein